MKAFFPVSAMATNLAGMIISILIYLGLGTLVGWVCSALSGIWVIGTLASMIGTVVGVYLLIGIVLAVVTFLKNKD